MWNSSAGDCCSSKYCPVFTQNWNTCLVGSRIYRGTPVWMWISTSNEYSSSLLELHGEVSDCGRVLSACRYENTGMKTAFKKNKCLYMKCKQIWTCNVDVLYSIYMCANVMSTLHTSLKLKLLRNKTQPHSGISELLLVASLAASWVALSLT